jgi:hypothetical protein
MRAVNAPRAGHADRADATEHRRIVSKKDIATKGGKTDGPDGVVTGSGRRARGFGAAEVLLCKTNK